MLLDRKKIRKWAKWVSLGMAIVFAGGFLFLGVGYGGAGFNVSAACTGNQDSQTANPETPEEKIAAFEATLAADPKDVTALLGLANIYDQMGQPAAAATYLEKVAEIQPGDVDILLRLAAIYMNAQVSDYSSAVRVLNNAAELAPDNAQVFLYLGSAQKQLGNNSAAVLAWQRYLELQPEGSNADLVKAQIEKLTATTTTSTTSSSTTTTTAGGSTTSIAPTSTTTVSSTTTTTAK